MQSLVTFNNERLTTTSLVVAEHFKKQHKNVIQSIENLVKEMELCQEGGRLNFQPSSGDTNQQGFDTVIHNPIDGYFVVSEYLNAQGKLQPMYEVTEEGFALLAMGFTGPEALKFKIAFLNAFKQLAAENLRYALTTLEIEKKVLLEDKEDLQFRLNKFYNMDTNGLQQQRGINTVRKFYKGMAKDVRQDVETLDKVLRKHPIDADTFNFYSSKLRSMLDQLRDKPRPSDLVA